MYNYALENFAPCHYDQLSVEEQIYGPTDNLRQQYCTMFQYDNPSCQWNDYNVNNNNTDNDMYSSYKTNNYSSSYWTDNLSERRNRTKELKLKYVSDKLARERQLRRNARERARQNRLNDAFDVLRNSLPGYLAPNKKQGKLTQMETLTLAKYYISLLKDLLDTGNEHGVTVKDEK